MRIETDGDCVPEEQCPIQLKIQNLRLYLVDNLAKNPFFKYKLTKPIEYVKRSKKLHRERKYSGKSNDDQTKKTKSKRSSKSQKNPKSRKKNALKEHTKDSDGPINPALRAILKRDSVEPFTPTFQNPQ